MNNVKREFVTNAFLKEASTADLGRDAAVPSAIGDKWTTPARADGLNVLAEQSRRPRESPKQLAEEVTCALIRVKLRHPSWGPEKVCELYEREHRRALSASDCDRVLSHAGLVETPRRQVLPERGRIAMGVEAKSPNEVWTVDLRGRWGSDHGELSEPLTVCDAFSRFILAVQTLPKATTPNVRTAFVRLFEEYGMPNVIKTINGCPFASTFTPLGLSSLSTWWVSLGIEWDRVQPAHLQENGGQKRLHRDLQAEIAQHLQPDPVRQQAALDRWREEFNGKRPHEAHGGRPPGEVYRKSTKSFHSCAGALEYGPGHFPRKISPTGTLRWYSRMIFVSHILAGYSVGLKLRSTDQLEVWFSHLHLGDIELQTSRFLGAPIRPKEEAPLSA